MEMSKTWEADILLFNLTSFKSSPKRSELLNEVKNASDIEMCTENL